MPDITQVPARDLHALLKSETAAAHLRLEALPFFQALRAGILPAIPIVSFLRSLTIIHAVLEGELSRSSDFGIREFQALAPPKVRLLVADLSTMGAERLPSVIPAINLALEYSAEILARSDSPLSLLGPLYVLEGSQMGGAVLRRSYAHCLGLEEEQLSYAGCYGSNTAAHWKAFVAGLETLVLDQKEKHRIADSAVRCFERLDAICAALYPYAEHDLKHHVAAVNHEAGDHAMPQDPLEIALALRAGRAAWTEFPYLEARFGERGKRFTSSDSCWLVALTRMPVPTATRNLQWLRTVLASRGIPTVILETHLRAISQALAADFDEGIELGARFLPFLSELQLERHATIGAESMARLVGEFDARLRICDGATIASTARLITSAWLDERHGVPGALAATRDWFVDPGRFSPAWIVTVDELVAALDYSCDPSC